MSLKKLKDLKALSMSKVDLIAEELWDHYSGLPNPAWYQYKKELIDEEEDTENSTSTRVIDEKI
jgi:hypothetical protein